MKAKIEKDSLNSRLHLEQPEKAGPNSFSQLKSELGYMDLMPCAGMKKNTILLGIRIMEKRPYKGAGISGKNTILRRRNNGGKMPYKGAGIMKEKCHTFRPRNIKEMPYFRPKKSKENAML